MANAQTIQKFYQTAYSSDFSRDFLFRVKLIQGRGLPSFSPDELVYVKAASLPAREIQNVPVKYMGLGFNIPGGVTYPGSDAYELEFFVDASSDVRRKFEIVSRELFNDLSSTGAYETPDASSIVQLVQLDKGMNELDTYSLIGASLRKINPIEYKISEGKGDAVSCKVTLAYQFYTVATENPNATNLIYTNTNSILQP